MWADNLRFGRFLEPMRHAENPHTAPGLPDREPNLAAGRKATLAITAAADELRSIVRVAGAYVES